MTQRVIYSRVGRAELKSRLAEIPRILSGRLADQLGIARGFRLRLAVAWLSKIKLAFIVKSRGGTDEAGISWPPLSKKYLAYGRGPKSTRHAGGFAPGGKDGFMTKGQLATWRKIYSSNLGRLALTMPLSEAKGIAAAIAWNIYKREGGLTKLLVFGNRQVEILRDRGLLFNSLSPGILNEAGPSADYTPTEDQVVEDRGTELAVGTNVAYAAPNHRRRPLWPRADQIPDGWKSDLAEAAATGIPVAIEMLSRGAA